MADTMVAERLENPADQVPPPTASLLGCIMVVAAVHRVIEDQKAAEALAAGLIDRPARPAATAFARGLNLKAVFHTVSLVDLDAGRLPLAFRTRDGDWRVLARLTDEHALVHSPGRQSPSVFTPEVLSEFWSGDVVYVRGRRRSRQALRPFNVTWFIPEFLRYRSLALEVLGASVFIEMMALLTPLFLQVVMDKVIVHQSMKTLDVLVTALLVVAVLEALLKCLRKYVATQTSTRIDARLGARLFDKLMELPISYFQSRSVGLTVMRLRELDSIREFLSGAANTLIVDLVFTGVFFAVMYVYSPVLAGIVAASIPCYFILAFVTTPLLQRRIEAMFRDGAINNAFLTETLAGMETVKALAPSCR
ncbi:ABC transporter transmembrane domain-containing protein [Phyllobacterium phragmitis]|uniref:ABC transporter transmembrane domain-containing protein n=1 Tax=Phyllobacterium phragmitis TaxID=2670329 RepID=UPI0013047E67|nr:ABC transporter transmembrane domain-containing protein [Phyllobacterium phragmitis]